MCCIYLFVSFIYFISLGIFIYIGLQDKIKYCVLRFCLLVLVTPELLAMFGHLGFFELLMRRADEQLLKLGKNTIVFFIC